MSVLTIYDISLDEHRPATQEDIDQLQKIVSSLYTARNAEAQLPLNKNFDFKLAVYTNPHRIDGVFVAENKPIEPYKNITGIRGEALYPAVPKTQYYLGNQVEYYFAHELVRRWNRGP